MAKYGAGSVYPLANGKWAGQWSNGRRDDGSRDRGTVTADSEAATWKALAAARGKSSSTRPRKGGESVGAFLERWLVDVVKPTRRERTLLGYRSIVSLHLVPAFGERPLRSLGRREVQGWVNRQTDSPTSVRHRVDCLRSAMSYAVRWGLIDANPASDLDLPSPVKRTVKALRPEDAKALLSAVEGQWFAPLVTVALYTGLRQGELLGLRWEDVNLGHAARATGRTGPGVDPDGDGVGTGAGDREVDGLARSASVTVHHSLARLPGPRGTRYVLTEPKSDHSRRTVPLAAPALAVLRDLRRDSLAVVGNAHHLVFTRDGKPIDGTRLTHEFQDCLEAKELPAMRWHDLRHATASLLIAEGVGLAVVSSILGHSGISITVDTYGHLTDDTKRDAMASLGRAVG
jgi:integrase